MSFIFDAFKNKLPEISEEAKNVLTDIENSITEGFELDFSNGFVGEMDIADKSLKAFLLDANYADKTLSSYENYLKNASSQTSKFASFTKKAGSALKTFGAYAVNIAASMAIAYGISKAIELWQDYANAQEDAIERGNEAVSNMESQQKRIESAQSVLQDLKDDIRTLTDGTEVTRFEQLATGVDSLGRNVSLTTAEFEEYNSILQQLEDAGFTATNSISNLEEQMKSIRREANIETLSGLGDWIDSFNAKNNQEVTDFSKEVGYQQQLRVLNKMYDDPLDLSDSIEQVKTYDTWWEKLGATLHRGQLLFDATNSSDEFTKNANLDAVASINEAMSNTDALEKLAKEYSIDIFDEDGNFSFDKYSSSEVQSQLQGVIESLEGTIESTVRQSSGFLQAMFENSLGFDSISESATSAIAGIFNNIDYDTISSYMMNDAGLLSEDLMRDWVNGLSQNLTNPYIQEQLNALFSLDSNNLGFNEYQSKAENLIKSISSAVPELSSDLLKKTSGVDDVVEKLQGSYNKLLNEFGVDNVNKLSNKEIEIAARIVGVNEFDGTFDDLLKQIYMVKSELDFDATPFKDAIDKAFESENAGDIYVDMVDKLAQAKELYDKGLVGTDDFKSVAAWLSPTGSDDAMNFQENWGKAKRYFTDDSAKGVHNFLKDLESKNLAESTKAFDANGNAIEKWTYNITDLEEAAKKLGIGFEPMMAMFGRLEDYGFSNNFVSSIEQGQEHIAEKTKELADAEARLVELQTTDPKNHTAIDAQRDKIAQLKQDIIETTDVMKQLASSSAKDYEAEVESAKTAIEALEKERKKVLADDSLDKDTRESVAAMMQDQIDAWAKEYHIELEGEANVEEVNVDKQLSEDFKISMVIDGEEDLDTLYEQLKNLPKDEVGQVTIDVQNEEQLDGTLAKVEAIPDNVSASLSFIVSNEEEMDRVTAKMDEINANRGTDSQISYTVTVNSDESISDVEAIDNKKIDDKNYKANLTNYALNINRLNAINNKNISDKEYTVTQRQQTIIENPLKVKTSKASGTLSPALVSGTAYNMLNLKPAYAGGKVALDHDQTALVNELGM